MATRKGKPTGYQEKMLSIDCETTGLTFGGDNPSIGHQAVSWGVLVTDCDTLKVVEELYVEIKWNETSLNARLKDPSFGKKAESIHGLTFDYLEENGMDEGDAVAEIGGLILKYWGPENCIQTLGHNVHTFDMPFLRAMFNRHGIPLKFGARHVDSFSIGFGTIGSWNSDDLFATMGFDERGTHNALDDIKLTLDSVRRIRVLWQKFVGIDAYEE